MLSARFLLSVFASLYLIFIQGNLRLGFVVAGVGLMSWVIPLAVPYIKGFFARGAVTSQKR